MTRRARSRQAKLLGDPVLREYVQVRLRKKWSPQQISNRLIKDFPAAPEMRVCPGTIYQAIYVHAKGELRRELGSSCVAVASLVGPTSSPTSVALASPTH